MFKRVDSNNKVIGKIESNHKVLFVRLRLIRTIRLKYRYNNGHLLITDINQSTADEIERAKVIEIDGVKYELIDTRMRYDDLWNEFRIEGDSFVSQLARSRLIQYKQYNDVIKLYA